MSRESKAVTPPAQASVQVASHVLSRSSRMKTWLTWAAVVALTAVPLVWVGHGPVNEQGAAGELFQGADSRAQEAITRIAPDYKPWFSPVLEPSSNEIASLLFALQAAVGAGVIGYWLGLSKARANANANANANAGADADADADGGGALGDAGTGAHAAGGAFAGTGTGTGAGAGTGASAAADALAHTAPLRGPSSGDTHPPSSTR